MLSRIAEKALHDDALSSLLGKTRDCAAIYLLVVKRRKGCDGMGELAMVREEFGEAIDDLARYCKEKEYPFKDFEDDLESAARALLTSPLAPEET